MTDQFRYHLLQRLLHWAVALCVIFVLPLGLTLGVLGFEGLKNNFGMDATNFIYKYHKTFGVIILVLMIARLAARLILGKPEYDAPLPGISRVASRISHWMLYVLLLIQPVLGWTATSAGGFPAEFFNWKLPALLAKDPALSKTLYALHGTVGLLLLVLVTIHISAALAHRYMLRDTVMKRMSLF
ncbi:MAG: cytochrome b [Paracoccaceae bacterium]